MTQQPATTTEPWYVRPRVMLPLVSLIILAVVFTTPEPASQNNDTRLTTFSTRPPGARMFYELADRLDWNVERTTEAALPLDSTSIIAILAPVRPLRGSDVHHVLEHVRGGGALFVVAEAGGSPIADSLGLEEAYGGTLLVDQRMSRSCPLVGKDLVTRIAREGARFVHYSAMGFAEGRSIQVDTLLAVTATASADSGAVQPVMLGIQLGRGRIVITKERSIVRNDAVRVCSEGVDIHAVRALEYLTAPGNASRRIVFDEYHQGFGMHSGSLRAILTQFRETRPGKVFYQLAGAGLILLLAAAPRALPPRELQPPDRRSPLEHVDALARAYQQVGATRTAAQRLLHGLRRRVDRGVLSQRTADADDRFLRHVEERHPALKGETAIVREALAGKIDRARWSELPRALDTIERTLTRT